MKIIEGFSPRGPDEPPLAVAIGNFDGVHLGHRAILRRLGALAGEGGISGAITFTPHTRWSRSRGGPLLTTLEQRFSLLEARGVQVCWLARFERELADLDARSFVEEILVGKLRIRGLCVGFNYRFGRGREGNADLLRSLAASGGFALEVVPPVEVAGRPVSSSLIRELIARGEVETAAVFLGRDHVLTGRIVRGDSLGTGIGWPTANFVPEQFPPAPGVYAALADFGRGDYPALFYLGARPTLGNGLETRAEAHILDWEGDIYGRDIKVRLKKLLREDIKFNSVEELTGQMRLDAVQAREIFNRDKTESLKEE